MDDATLRAIVAILRRKGMTERAIDLWLATPHKIIGMQIPKMLIAVGRGDELLRIIDER